jgi:predicted  nucleic acid-binding Zn-ribbon protein
MAPWSPEKIGQAAQEVADQLLLTEHVKALQQGQKQMADAIALIDSRLRQIETDIRAVTAEAKFEAIKETTHMLQTIQGAFHDKLTHLTLKVAQLENGDGASSGALPALSNETLQDGVQAVGDDAVIDVEARET